MRTKRFLHVAVLLLVLFCLLFTLCGCGCVLNREYAKGLREGKYPTASDFPDTRWDCRELDLVLYMIRGTGMFATYTVNGQEYRGRLSRHVASPRLSFDFYSSTEKTVSEYDPALLYCEPVEAGFIYTFYEYDKETGLIVCKVYNSQSVDGETVPETLTFEKTGTFGETPKTRWVAEEIGLYLDSFSDIDGYFRGEITLGGEKQTVQAVEIGNGHYYKLSTSAGQQAYLSFAISEDRIVATRADTDGENEWDPDVKTITFRPAPVE